jgi:hypothetical protein
MSLVESSFQRYWDIKKYPSVPCIDSDGTSCSERVHQTLHKELSNGNPEILAIFKAVRKGASDCAKLHNKNPVSGLVNIGIGTAITFATNGSKSGPCPGPEDVFRAPEHESMRPPGNIGGNGDKDVNEPEFEI